MDRDRDAVPGDVGNVATFTFLDPAGNLLEQSEEFGAAAWTNGALIELTAGIGDPLGTTRATRVVNAGSASTAVAQTLAVPGNFEYCLSVWARTTAGSSVTLTIGTGGEDVRVDERVDANFVRVEFGIGRRRAVTSGRSWMRAHRWICSGCRWRRNWRRRITR